MKKDFGNNNDTLRTGLSRLNVVIPIKSNKINSDIR